MQAASSPAWIPVEDYISGEQNSDVRQEYIGGALHAMARASREHNIISLNLAAALHAHLRGKPLPRLHG